jgi:CheY-like chemotaxis protein
MNRKILLAGSLFTLRSHIYYLFEDAGYGVLQADDGLTALAQLVEGPEVELLVVTADLSKLSGLELAYEVRRSAKLCHLPIVVVAAPGEIEGLAGLISPPVALVGDNSTADQLIATAGELLSRTILPVRDPRRSVG